MISHEEAKSIVGAWLEHRWIETDMEPYDLTPILADIERVNAHLDAEYDRIEAAEKADKDVLQAAADLLPRRRYRLTYKESDGRFVHRVPIDCWAGRTYSDKPAGLYVHLEDHAIRHGSILEVLSRQGGERQPDDHIFTMRCECISEAIIEATDEWVAAHTGESDSWYHPIAADTTLELVESV